MAIIYANNIISQLMLHKSKSNNPIFVMSGNQVYNLAPIL